MLFLPLPFATAIVLFSCSLQEKLLYVFAPLSLREDNATSELTELAQSQHCLIAECVYSQVKLLCLLNNNSF